MTFEITNDYHKNFLASFAHAKLWRDYPSWMKYFKETWLRVSQASLYLKGSFLNLNQCSPSPLGTPPSYASNMVVLSPVQCREDLQLNPFCYSCIAIPKQRLFFSVSLRYASHFPFGFSLPPQLQSQPLTIKDFILFSQFVQREWFLPFGVAMV